jgi:UDP-glucose 4-epimerase
LLTGEVASVREWFQLMDKGGVLSERLSGRKVLVTGATGFVGSHLVGQLASLGADVIAAGVGLGWRPVVRRLVRQGLVRFVDLRSFWHPASLKRVAPAFTGVEYVVHLGYEMPRGNTAVEKEIDDNLRNVVGTLRLVQSLPTSVKKICFASSASVYGPYAEKPVSETDDPHPATIYAIGKGATENYLKQYAIESAVSVSVLRYATIYGPLETDPRAIPNFIRQVLAGKPPIIHGDGEDVRDYVHVTDVVNATVSALTLRNERFQLFNIGSGKGYSTRQIAEHIIDQAAVEMQPIIKGEQSKTTGVVCNISRAKTELGYKPQVDLEEGLHQEIEWFRNHPQLWEN